MATRTRLMISVSSARASASPELGFRSGSIRGRVVFMDLG